MRTDTSARVSISAATMVALVVVAGLVASGCSGKRGGGWFGRGGGGEASASAGIGEEGLAGQPSLAQFEETGTVVGGGVYRDVSFAFDSYQLDSMGMDAVQHNASILQNDSGKRVEIEGHCDDRGTSEYNLALGAKRARAVKDALVGMGIGTDRMDTVSYGEELPLCSEPSESCWATNRRAHLVDR